jgi:S-adenosylmethionine:tRNA ribosyltransferase-isomerase
MNVQDIRIEDYQYELPAERIARYPLTQRDASKLLIHRQGQIQEDSYANIARYLPEGALMLFNNTKVIPARIYMAKPSGGLVEIFCLEPLGEISSALSAHKECEWKCLIGGAKKWKEGPVTASWGIDDGEIHQLSAEITARLEGYFQVKFRWQPSEFSFAEVLSAVGQIPLPPYLNREVEALDRERYQTIYANFEGSVAAPTAGLHFTEAIFQQLASRAIEHEYVTLHVGAGTFKPVSAPTIGDHDMHAEYFDVSLRLIETLQRAHTQKRPVIAVGTTTLRTLESLYLMGCKLIKQPQLTQEELEIKQWDAYQLGLALTERSRSAAPAALEALSHWLQKNNLDRIIAKTQLFIAPGYEVKMISGLCTNFHQPGSTLLLLVAALVGEEWKKVYQHALDREFRFLSYGDGCYLDFAR